MRAIPTGILLAIGVLAINQTGCQIGKPNLGSLTWWKKNDELASKYVEPPSHQFSPSESAIVSDDPNLPPLPPDIEKTVDAFQQEIDRSYRELAKDSQKANREFIASLEKGTSELMKIAEGPIDRSEVRTSESNPLPPKASTQSQAIPEANNNPVALAEGAAAIPKPNPNDNGNGFKPGGGGSFQAFAIPQAKSTESEPPGFPQDTSNGLEPLKTPEPNYERLAENTFTPTESNSTFQPDSSAPPADFQTEPKIPLVPSESPSPKADSGFVPYTPEQNSSFPNRIPELPKELEPKSTVPPASTPEYPRTPHKPFETGEAQSSSGFKPPASNQNEKMAEAFLSNGSSETVKAPAISTPAPIQKTKSSGYTPGSISSSGSLDNGEWSLPPMPGNQ